MKIFSIMARRPSLVRGCRATAEERLRWLRDPLSHPALEAMTQRELGDLPLSR